MIKARIAKVLFWLSIIVIILVSIQPGASTKFFSGLDKFAHFISFFTITFLFLVAFKLKKPYLSSMILLAAFGLGIEVVQHYLPYRISSWYDFVADITGIIFGGLLFKWLGSQSTYERESNRY